MSRKDFELIAATIKGLIPGDMADTNAPVFSVYHRQHVAWRFAEALRRTNNRFNAERFLRACGVDQ